MNERDLRTKKQSLVLVKNANDKTFNNSHIKLGPNCQPKQPPNISRHYLETRKKQAVSKELIKQDIMIYCYEVERVKSKILMQTRQSRPSHSKYQQDNRLKKTKRQPHYISKPHKAKNPKICSKQNRQSRSNMDFEERREKQKMTKTQVFQQKNAHIHNSQSLTCKQKIMKKLKKNIKQISHQWQQSSKTKTSNWMMIQTAIQHPTPKKSFPQQICEFEQKISKMQIESQSQTLSQLFYKQQLYSNIPNYNCYLNRNQNQITWLKRAKILAEMGSRREVFGLAVSFVDRYLASTFHLEQDRLQILACAAMSIANKIQGLTFSIGSFRIPGISFTEILELEQQVCRVLKWKLNPPTLNMWANRMAQHWDLYLQHNANSLPKLLEQNVLNIRFKDTESYLNFRTLMQYIDIVLLDIETLQYHNRQLAASFIYLMLTQKLNMYSKKQIFVKFPTSSQYLIRENDLNDFYCDFLQKSFGFTLQDLLPTVQYCSTFIMLPLTFQLPAGVHEEDNSEIPFSEFCSLITYNTSNLNYLNSRIRQTD